MTVESDVAVIKEVVVRVEAHVEELNGTVAGLQEEHLIQKGMLMAMRMTMGLTFAVVSAAAGIMGIIVAIWRFGG